MKININFFYKLIFLSIFISLSTTYFLSGYKKLNKNIVSNNSFQSLINKKNITLDNNKNKVEKLPNKKIISENNNLNLSYDNKDEDEIYKEAEIELSNEEEIKIIVKKNDTFSIIIDPYIKDKNFKQKIIEKINKEYNLKYLKINQEILIYLNQNNKLSKIVMPISYNIDLILTIDLNNKIFIEKSELEIEKLFNSAKFEITNSLFEDGRKYGVPISVLTEIIRIYSFDVDFQRDIQKGNELEVMYETLFNDKRRAVSYGKILYTNLFLQKNKLEYYLFKTDENFYEYFNPEGKSVVKALMKTPIDGARLSSSFGMRKHPILGYNKLHKGLDFAAPTGTPIYAAGNGVIEFVGRNGSYGNYIRIRHNNSYKTAYAHLSKFKKKIYKGLRVNQGDIIGYVGSTGRSTGPHLHYEIIYNNEQINPMTMKLPSGKKLVNDELKRFLSLSKTIYSDFIFNLYE